MDVGLWIMDAGLWINNPRMPLLVGIEDLRWVNHLWTVDILECSLSRFAFRMIYHEAQSNFRKVIFFFAEGS